MTNKSIGKAGEEIAKDFLIKKGFIILEMNYKFSRIAEIDIIATKDNILHFVEVKTRTSDYFGSPLEAITRAKINYILKAASYYMMKLAKKYSRYQIDAIGIILKDEPEITFLENIGL